MGYSWAMLRRRQGLNIIEVLLASAIFAVMMVPMMGLFSLGNRFSLEGEREMQASLFALGVLEQLRADMDRWTHGSKRTVGVPRFTVEAPEGFTYKVDREVVERGLEKYIVRVKWKVGKSRERELELATLVSRLPCQTYQSSGRNLFRKERR